MRLPKHFILPDCQIKKGVDMSHLVHIGHYIVDKKPDVIINLGDFADMPSLCSYDKGQKCFEGRRYKEDIQAAKEGMDLLLGPMRKYNKQAAKLHRPRYRPRMVLTLGNHEERIKRTINFSPEYEGMIGYHDLPYEDWEVVDYLKPIDIDGVTYVHFLANPMSGKPYSSNAMNQLVKVGKSFVVGHKQTLDIATRFTLGGQQQWGIVAGACYKHQEDYKGYQGNDHFRGVLMLHRVINGSFDPCVISLDYLKDKYDHLTK
jgi:hypothetical protein